VSVAAPVHHRHHAGRPHRGWGPLKGAAELGPAPDAASTSVIQPVGCSTSTSTTSVSSIQPVSIFCLFSGPNYNILHNFNNSNNIFIVLKQKIVSHK
jgi:hypothetical protein